MSNKTSASGIKVGVVCMGAHVLKHLKEKLGLG